MVRASALVVLVALAGCHAKPPPARPPTPVTVATAQTSSLPIEVEAAGTVVPLASVAVSPRVGGQIKRVSFTEGQHVNAGDLLFEIDRAPYAASLAQAEAVQARDQAALETATTDSARYDAMVAQGLAAVADAEVRRGTLKSARAAVAADRAAIDLARLNVAWTQVRSPIAGRTDRRQLDAGNVVVAGAPVVVVRQTDPIDVTFALPQDRLASLLEAQRRGPVVVTIGTAASTGTSGSNDAPASKLRGGDTTRRDDANVPGDAGTGSDAAASNVRSGDSASDAPASNVRTRAEAGAPASTSRAHTEAGTPAKRGVLSFVGGAVDASNGTVACKARFDNADDALWPGAYARVTVRLGVMDGVVVPSAAVATGQKGAFVFVVKPDDTVEMRDVTVRVAHGDEDVVDGVRPGEIVVVDGQLSLGPGAHVEKKP